MNPKTILVPLDFSDVTPAVVEAASSLAKAFGAHVTLLHISDPDPDFVGYEAGPESVRMAVARDFRSEHQKLEEWKQQLAGAGVEAASLHIQGPHADKILQEAERLRADLIVMGSHGHGPLYDLLVGTVTSGILKRTRCPVLVVPAVRAGADTH